VVRAIDTKLLRDLWSLRMQVISIALVIACGIAGFIGSLSTHESLLASRDRYYDSARFPHVFASITRAPRSLEERLRRIPGVVDVETRVVRDAQVSIPGVAPPMIVRMIGVDFARLPAMSRLTLTAGRWPAPQAADEVVMNERFFAARGLALGGSVEVLVNGRLERFAVTGTALSPEYIYASRGGAMPDDEWFGILWVNGERLAAAYDMTGAFDSALLRLERNASVRPVIAAADALLAPYGGYGAVGREDQVSDRILTQEINQQKVFGTVLPAIFLAVAAFILNVVLHRQVHSQRPEIAALKALGYDNRQIAMHYLRFASVIVILGVVLGTALGTWFGHAMTQLYTRFFHFPEFDFIVSPMLVLTGAGVSLAAAFAGTLAAMRSVVVLRAAEALRPPAPARFRPLLVERLGYAQLLTPPQRMVMRNHERQPVRAAITVAGVAGAVAILIAGIFWGDALDRFVEVQFYRASRGDIQVGFVKAIARAVQWDLQRLHGVEQAEVMRSVPARLEAGHRTYRTAINGIQEDAALTRMFDGRVLRPMKPSPDGVVLTDRLAQRLGVVPGDLVRAELLEGERVARDLRIAGVVHEIVGMNAWMRLEDLNALAAGGDLVSGAQLRIDTAAEPALLAALKAMPGAAVVIVNRTLLQSFRDQSARNVLFFTSILSAFAATIAVGVVYNNARIQLAERAWELASLRVLGFTRREVSVLLLSELGIEIAAAIPLGLVGGFWLAALLIYLMPHEVLELPLVIYPSTYAFAAGVVSAAGILSALVVRNRINRLDLVAVLKTRE
jgi:putative ABC transport system permease protein